MEVLELTSMLELHACSIGVPLLIGVLKEEGMFEDRFGAGTRWEKENERVTFREKPTRKKGYWHVFWDDF